MNHTYSARCGELILRPIEELDIEKIRLLRNRNRDCFVFAGEITPEEQQAWYRNYLSQVGDYMFSIFFQNKWVGTVGLYDVVDGQAEFGRLLVDKSAAGRGGLGIAVTASVCQIGFQQLYLTRICLEVYTDNIPAQITYLKAGFQATDLLSDQNGRKMLRMTATSKTVAGLVKGTDSSDGTSARSKNLFGPLSTVQS